MFDLNYVDIRIFRYKENGSIIGKTLYPLVFKSSDGKKYMIPIGFETDFASVPKIFWNIYPPIGKYTNAAILHDWLYSGNGGGLGLTRKQCDNLFKEAMRASLVNSFNAWVLYIFVRVFGKSRFTK